MKRIFTIVCVLSLFGSYSASAQSGVFKNVSISPSLGVLNYFGDIKNHDSFTTESGGNESSLGYGLGISKGITKVFGVRLQGIGGKLKGTKDTFGAEGVYFDTDVFEAGLHLDINLTNILLDESKFGVVLSGGYGYTFFDASTYNVSNDSQYSGRTTQGDVTSSGLISAGLSAYYQISPRLDVFGRGSYKLVMSDELDSWTGLEPLSGNDSFDPNDASTYAESDDDTYSYIAIGLTYHFAKSSKSPDSKGSKGKSVEELAEEARLIEDQRIAEEMRLAEEKRQAEEMAEKERIAAEEKLTVADPEVASMYGNFTYNGLPAANKKLNLVDENDKVIATTTTDANGNFTFHPLMANKNYIIKADENEGNLNEGDIYLTNKDGDRVAKANEPGVGSYTFVALGSDDLNGLPLLASADGGPKTEKPKEDKPKTEKPKVDKPKEDKPKVEKTDKPKVATAEPKIVGKGFENETIFFRHNSFWVSQNQSSNKGKIIAEKLKAKPQMRILIQGWASRVGNTDYNLLLSQRRADKLKSILVSKYGIDSNRIETVGKGEVENTSVSDEKARKAEIFEIK